MSEEDTPPSKPPHRRWKKRITATLLLVALAGLGAIFFEGSTSFFQSLYFHSLARKMTFGSGSGPSASIRFPKAGPFDERLGYVRLPEITRVLEEDFLLVSQARSSKTLLRWADRGVGPIYHEKTAAGLEIQDPSGRSLYTSRYPQRIYPSYGAIPPLVVSTLLFIENRELLQERLPYKNPAVEWDRFVNAGIEELGRRVFDPERNVTGGSTLATQIEKFRHSRGGFTSGPKEKLRQMLSASIRAYSEGRETMPARERIILDYVNSIPLAAAPEHGEVNGLGDGLWAWYGTDFIEANTALVVAPEREADEADVRRIEERRAIAYREVLSLLLAQRRPSYYLRQDPEALERLTDSYLRLLTDAGAISPQLRDDALLASARIRTPRFRAAALPAIETKPAVAIRARIASLLGVQDLYELDRFDLCVTATLDSSAQGAVADLLLRLRDPDFAAESGLLGHRLLKPEDLGSVVYSVTLHERTRGGNMLRVQVDTFDGAINLNDAARLELGSTAKLRTLVTYLEIVAELYREHAGRTRAELARLEVHAKDALTRWVIDRLAARPGDDLPSVLDAAMLRVYSGNPGEKFFTGGGLHTFTNFDRKHNSQMLTVREAFRESVNLVFIRLMRDVVYHYTYRGTGPAAQFLADTGDSLRHAYLERFADLEGSQFLRRYYRKYEDLPPEERTAVFFEGVRRTPKALTIAFLEIRPKASREDLARFLTAELPHALLTDRTIGRLYEDYAPEKLGLEDKGYLAGVHPLELWLVAFLVRNPEASPSEVLAESRDERQQVYTWLFRTKRKNAQDVRIRSLVEIEAFLEVQRAWSRLGYPFSHLAPSYATAIGSSGDRPAALAELMGLIVSGGVRVPSVRVTELRFASDTPYETRFVRRPREPEQILDPTVAEVLRRELVGVVESGTAQRAFESVVLANGTVLPVGGKTGTGDNRLKSFSPKGKLVGSTVLNRTATFVFLVGDRFFGTIVAYVPGEAAKGFGFTSALPVQIWKTLAPSLVPLFSRPPLRDPSAERVSQDRASAEGLP